MTSGTKTVVERGYVRKAGEARHCIDLKSRQLQEYFDLKSRYSGYDLKSHPARSLPF